MCPQVHSFLIIDILVHIILLIGWSVAKKVNFKKMCLRSIYLYIYFLHARTIFSLASLESLTSSWNNHYSLIRFLFTTPVYRMDLRYDLTTGHNLLCLTYRILLLRCLKVSQSYASITNALCIQSQ